MENLNESIKSIYRPIVAYETMSTCILPVMYKHINEKLICSLSHFVVKYIGATTFWDFRAIQIWFRGNKRKCDTALLLPFSILFY